METLPNDSLTISLVIHQDFCSRRAWLEMNGERTDTSQMQEGHTAHARVDDSRTSTGNSLHSLRVYSKANDLVGICDSVERLSDGSVRVVEYKSTPVRKTASITPSNRLQLALQGICLKEMGYVVSEYAVYFTDHRKTVTVNLTEDDYAHALQQIEATRALAVSDTAPEPLDEDPQCSWCSHVSVCLPDENRGKVRRRRVLAANPEGQTLHLTEQGARASKRNGRLEVTKGGKELGSIPLERIESVVVHGNIDLSSALIRELAWNHRPIVWFSSSGRLYGWMLPGDGPNGLARVRQHVLSDSGFIPVAGSMMGAKIYNQATLLRRHGGSSRIVARLRELQDLPLKTHNLSDVFGIEGEAASLYFSNFGSMLNDSALEALGSTWTGRVGRGANDEINILLNYAYGMLLSECVRALIACGLDPHAGFLHSSNRNKPACALDLMEEFRPVVADSVVLTLVNRHEVSPRDFQTIGGSLSLRPSGRKAVVRAFERRMQTQFKHPAFGYTISWRRAIEVQARLLLGVIDGTHSRYEGIKGLFRF